MCLIVLCDLLCDGAWFVSCVLCGACDFVYVFVRLRVIHYVMVYDMFLCCLVCVCLCGVLLFRSMFVCLFVGYCAMLYKSLMLFVCVGCCFMCLCVFVAA